jgi:hypothetical protein
VTIFFPISETYCGSVAGRQDNLSAAGNSSLRQRPAKFVYPDKCFATIITLKLIVHFSNARQAATILSSDPPKIVAGLIPSIGTMLVLLLVYQDTCRRSGTGEGNL